MKNKLVRTAVFVLGVSMFTVGIMDEAIKIKRLRQNASNRYNKIFAESFENFSNDVSKDMAVMVEKFGEDVDNIFKDFETQLTSMLSEQHSF